MAFRKSKGKKSAGISVDFEGVEAGGRSLPDGTYACVVDGIPELKESQGGNEYISWTLKVDSGKYKGRKVWHNTSLQPQALWNLRNMLEAMGIQVEDGAMDLELDEFEGQAVGVIVVNEKYEGKDRPRASEFIPVEDVEDDDGDDDPEEDGADEDDEPSPKKTSRKKKAPEPEFKVGQKVTFEDDGEEVAGKITELEEEVATVKVGRELYEVEVSDLSAA